MQRFIYTDSEGTERVMQAKSLAQAKATVEKIERERSGSHAAASLAVGTLRLI